MFYFSLRSPGALTQPRWVLGSLVGLLLPLVLCGTAAAQATFSTAEEAYSAGVKFLNDGNLAAARDPLETALILAKDDVYRMKVQQALMVPYRELPEIEPLQKAAEFIITNSDQPAERSLTRRHLLTFIQRRGKMDSAIEGYEARLKKSPQDRTLLYLLTEAHATYKKDAERSAKLAETLTAVERKAGKELNVSEQAHLAQQYIKARKYAEGAELFERIAPLDLTLEAWHFKEAAAAWLKANEAKKAVAAAKKSAAATPEKRNEQLTYFWSRGLADVFLEANEPALAIPFYEQAITLTKIDGYLTETQGKLLTARGKVKK